MRRLHRVGVPVFRRFGAGELPLPNNSGQQTDLPSQRYNPLIRRVPPYDPHIQADEVQLFREREMLRKGPSKAPPTKPIDHTEIIPNRITLVDFSGKISAIDTPQLVLRANFWRRRFIVINPDSALEALYLMFKNAPRSMIPIPVGSFWEEKGPTVSIDEIYLQAHTVGHAFGAYEGLKAEIPPDIG